MYKMSTSVRKNRFMRSTSSHRGRGSRASSSMPRKALKNVIKKVRKIEKSDPVFVTSAPTQITSSHLNSTPVYTLLNGISQGDTQLTRDGIQVNWKSLKLSVIYAAGTALSTPTFFRYIIVREESCLGSAPTTQQIFNDSTPEALSTYNVTNRDVAKRYKIYYDSGIRTICGYAVNYSAGTSELMAGGLKSTYTKTHKLKFNFITNYSRGNAGTVADIDTNSLYLICFTDSAVANGVTVTISYTLYGQDH